jgi:diguanylate cyclase (GGDEF)-like protein/PAS domain S-box-containing protein
VVVATNVIGFLLILSILIHAGRVQDEVAAEASQRQVEGLVWMTGRRLAAHVHDYAVWDDAVEGILVSPDRSWWDDNPGQYLLSAFDLALTLAFEGERILFVSTMGETREAPIDDLSITSSLQALLETERRAGSGEDAATVGLFELEGDIYLGAVCRIRPENEASAPMVTSSGLLLFAMSVEGQLLGELEEIMDGVRLVSDAAVPSGSSRLPVALADGQAAGVIAWTPPAPGRSIIVRVLPLAVLAFLSIAGLTLVFALRARDLARRLASDARARRALLARYESILETAGDGIFGVDTTGRVLFVNPAAAAMLGYPRKALIDRDARTFLVCGISGAEEGEDHEDTPLQRALATGRLELRDSADCRRADGTRFPVEYSASPIMDQERVTGAVVVFRDITKRRESEEELFYRANFDIVTGLPNRSLLLERLGQELKLARREDKRVGVLFIDLDDFKAVNDSLGHQAGDLLLRGVAERLQRRVRETDTVARLGGDEFVVLLAHVADRACTERVADQLIRSLAEGFMVADQSVRVGASIGIALFPEHGDSPAALIDRADAAMYRAKSGGRSVHRMAE